MDYSIGETSEEEQAFRKIKIHEFKTPNQLSKDRL